MAAKSLAGRACVHAAYEAEPCWFARSTHSAGTLIAFSKLRRATRTSAASSVSGGRLSACGERESINCPSAGSIERSCRMRDTIALWRPRDAAPPFGMWVASSQPSTEPTAPRSLSSSRRCFSSLRRSSGEWRSCFRLAGALALSVPTRDLALRSLLLLVLAWAARALERAVSFMGRYVLFDPLERAAEMAKNKVQCPGSYQARRTLS